MLKARRGAYDGRGNYFVDSESQISEAYEYFAGKPVYIERRVDFSAEVSVMQLEIQKGR